MLTTLTERELEEGVFSWHGQRIRARGLLRIALECRSFAGAWVNLPPAAEPSRGVHFVTVTGHWEAVPGRRYGHLLGTFAASLSVESLEPAPLEPELGVTADQLVQRRRELSGRVLELETDVRLALMTCRIGAIPIQGLVGGVCVDASGATDPVDRLASVVGVLDERASCFRLVRLEWRGEPRPVPIRTVAADDFATCHDEIVEVTHSIELGRYWPVVGGAELIVPELARTPDAFSYRTPPPGPLVAWQERLRVGGPIVARIRGRVEAGHRLRIFAYLVEPT